MPNPKIEQDKQVLPMPEQKENPAPRLVVPFLAVANMFSTPINQGGKRKGTLDPLSIIMRQRNR